MAIIVKDRVDFVVIGDGVSTAAVIDLAAAPLNMVFNRRVPDRVTVNAELGVVLASSLTGTVVSFKFVNPPSAGNGAPVSIALEYDL